MRDEELLAGLLDDGADTERAIADLVRRRAELDAVQEELERTVTVAEVEDNLVTVTVRGATEVTDIVLHDDVLREYAVRDLGPLVLRAVRKAMTDASRRVEQRVADILDDRPDPSSGGGGPG